MTSIFAAVDLVSREATLAGAALILSQLNVRIVALATTEGRRSGPMAITCGDRAEERRGENGGDDEEFHSVVGTVLVEEDGISKSQTNSDEW